MKDKKRVAITILHGAKSLICHITFFCELDLNTQNWCFVCLDIDVLSVGDFQKRGPMVMDICSAVSLSEYIHINSWTVNETKPTE